ncbi:MAG: hypothetical protein ACOYJO_00815 [Eubacterium sp.]|jgi:formate hydrogenlyase subunit 4
MPENGGLSIFILYAVIALFGFFVVTPITLNAISLFGVQRNFAEAMVREGVITEEDRKLMQPKKEIAGVIIASLLLAVYIGILVKSAPYGLITGLIAVGAGIAKYYKILQYNSLTVKNFKNTYKELMDKKKFDKFVKDHF